MDKIDVKTPEALLKGISIAMESALARITTDIVQGKQPGVTVLFFHEGGYRLCRPSAKHVYTLSRVYIEDYTPLAYGLIFEADYAEPVNGAKECLMMVAVNADDTAKVEHLPIVLNQAGERVIDDRRVMLTDDEYVHLFNPIDRSQFQMKLVNDLVSDMADEPLEPYSEYFIVAG